MFLMIHSSIQFGSSPDSAFIQQPEEDRKLLSARRFDVTKSATTSWAMVMRYRRMIQQKYNFNSNNLIDPMIIYVLRVPFSYILQSNIKKIIQNSKYKKILPFFFYFWHLDSSVLVYTKFFQETNKPDGRVSFIFHDIRVELFLSLAALKTEQFHKMWSILSLLCCILQRRVEIYFPIGHLVSSWEALGTSVPTDVWVIPNHDYSHFSVLSHDNCNWCSVTL
jgi:hypothetical protein